MDADKKQFLIEWTLVVSLASNLFASHLWSTIQGWPGWFLSAIFVLLFVGTFHADLQDSGVGLLAYAKKKIAIISVFTIILVSDFAANSVAGPITRDTAAENDHGSRKIAGATVPDEGRPQEAPNNRPTTSLVPPAHSGLRSIDGSQGLLSGNLPGKKEVSLGIADSAVDAGRASNTWKLMEGDESGGRLKEPPEVFYGFIDQNAKRTKVSETGISTRISPESVAGFYRDSFGAHQESSVSFVVDQVLRLEASERTDVVRPGCYNGVEITIRFRLLAAELRQRETDQTSVVTGYHCVELNTIQAETLATGDAIAQVGRQLTSLK